MDTPLVLDFRSPCGSYRLTFEDDGKVAYAYLKDNTSIVGDVWLYNRTSPPARIEWSDRKNIPFANCAGYISNDGVMQREIHSDDVLVNWERDEKGPIAYIYLCRDLYGVVGVGDKPGYARFAIKDGPLAQVMEMEDSG